MADQLDTDDPSAPSDAGIDTVTLLRRAKEGDRTALELLAGRLVPRFRRWARGRLPVWARDLRDTDDLVQDTVLRTLRSLNGINPHNEAELHAYLREAVWNHVRNEIRRATRKPPGEPLDDDRHESDAVSPLEAVVGRDELRRYDQALSRMTPEEREAIVSRLELGLSYRELAQQIGKPSPDAARKFVERAVARLADHMRRRRT